MIKTINFFISQSMCGKTQEEILLKRNSIIAKTLDYFLCKENKIAIPVNSFIKNAEKVNPLFCLGNAIQSLSGADIAIFANDWEKSRGCQIEHLCCEKYEIPIIYERNLKMGGEIIEE